MSNKRTSLRLLLSKEYCIKLMKEKNDRGKFVSQHEMAEIVRERNGGTCTQSTINYWLKRHGLTPDVPNRYMRTGIDVSSVSEAYDMDDIKATEPDPNAIDYFTFNIAHQSEPSNLIIMLSDLQIGALTVADGYDPIPEETVQKYVDTFCANLTEMFLRKEIRPHTINLCLLGDIVDGELMFPKHKTISMGDQLRIAVRVLRQIIEVIARYTDYVYVWTVAGNHGRITHTHHKSSNWDNIVYDTLALVYENDHRIFVYDDRSFVQVWEIGKWKFLATHGDIIRGMITRQKAINKSAGFLRRMPHDAMLMGHFHTVMFMDHNRMPIVTNGCMYDSEFIQNELAGWETKRMLVFKVGEGEYPIDWIEMIDVE